MEELDKKLNSFFGDVFHKRVFLICVFVALGLIIASFITPPMWIIDGSVLAAVGEIFAFAALGQVAAAIERGQTASVTHGGTTIKIGMNEDKKHRGEICEEQHEEETEEEND